MNWHCFSLVSVGFYPDIIGISYDIRKLDISFIQSFAKTHLKAKRKTSKTDPLGYFELSHNKPQRIIDKQENILMIKGKLL